MTRLLLLPALLIGLTFTLASTSEASVQVNWTGPSYFDDDTTTFSGFVANEITDIGGPGYYHSHNGMHTHSLEIRLDGVWTEVWSTGAVVSPNTNVATIATPILFAKGVVDGYRFLVDPTVAYGYHDFTSATFVKFDNTNTVPEPASMFTFAGLAMCLGAGGWYRRRRTKVTA